MASPKTLYFIDDDTDDLELFCEAINLIDEKIVCVPSADSEATLEAIRQNVMLLPDLIFLDLNMPRVDGRQFLREIKKSKQYADVPVIIFTTSSHEHDKEETKKLGASYFLTKPNTLSDLVEKLKYVLSRDWQTTSN